MTILSLVQVIGGVAMMLFGMCFMGGGLERLAGGKLERALEKLTDKRIKALFVGLFVTAIIQSSSATTVMVVGFVNSGIMQLTRAIGVIMGANIGTTVTAWILSLTGLTGDSIFIQLLRPETFAPILSAIGVVFYMFSKNSKRRETGTILIGFGVLIFGMDMLSAAVLPLANEPLFAEIFSSLSNPLLGVLAGTIITGIIQSSSASVGILQALSMTGGVTYASAIPIIMGQNIGTCATALIASIGTGKNAKRAALLHFMFNILGTVIILPIFYLLNAIIGFDFLMLPMNPADIAIVHTAFNVLNTIMLYPFANLLSKLSMRIIKDDPKEIKFSPPLLDERLLSSPSFAIQQSRQTAINMARLAQENFFLALSLFDKFSPEIEAEVHSNERLIDKFEDKLGTYLVKISGKDLIEEDSVEMAKLLHVLSDFERIGDHALNLSESARELYDKKIVFSDDALTELGVMKRAVVDIINMTIDAFVNGTILETVDVEALEAIIDELKDEIRIRHTLRVQDGLCGVEPGFVLLDIVNSFERISDHCSNIALEKLWFTSARMETHEYLSTVKTENSALFAKAVEKDRVKYSLHAAE
ncbi:MAG: Na/Pi cotransporter family protein [Clostridia bacterium]